MGAAPAAAAALRSATAASRRRASSGGGGGADLSDAAFAAPRVVALVGLSGGGRRGAASGSGRHCMAVWTRTSQERRSLLAATRAARRPRAASAARERRDVERGSVGFVAYDGNKSFKIPSTRLFRNEFPQYIFFQSSRTREARINGARIMENEFDLGETEEFEDIPGRPSTGD